MSEISLKASKRSLSTKGAVNQLRKSGSVPGVYYSKGQDPIALSVTENDLKPLVYTAETHLVDLQLENEEPKKCVIKNVQFDPVSDKMIHFDLQGLTVGQTLQIEVPILFTGQAIGVREGGVVQHHLHKLEVECLPKDIPDHITIDITNIKLGHSIHVSDLALENITILNPAGVIIVSVTTPRAATTETPVETEEDAAEPEVISKGKQEEKD